MSRPLALTARGWRGSRLLQAAVATGGVLAATIAALLLAARARGPVTFDVGPSTGGYLEGFADSEEPLPTTFRWSHGRAVARLPLVVAAGPARLTIRCARFVDHATEIEVSVAGRHAGAFLARPGGYRLHRLPVWLAAGPLVLELRSGDPELGVAVDWIRLEGAMARPRPLWPFVMPAGVLLLSLLAGFGVPAAATAGLAVSLLEAAWAVRDPFGLVHVTSATAAGGLALGLLAAIALRSRPGGRLVLWCFLAGYAVKASALFYPSYFYPDVRQNHRYVQALAAGSGSLEQRSRAAQEQLGVAYPRTVAGKKYAFPYSPVLYLPFTGIARPEAIVDALKQLALTAAAAEVLVVYLLASAAFGPGPGVAAALIAAALPLPLERLLLAMWSTVVGHLLDSLVVAAALVALRAHRLWAWLLLAAAVQLALVSYVSSLFTVSAFIACLALVRRREAAALLAVWLLPLLVTLFWLYGSFVALALREILPALIADARRGPTAGRLGLAEGLALALRRVGLFYGPGLLAFAVAGLLLSRRALPEVRALISAFALAVVGLVLLRGVSLGLLKDLKELEFATPLVAIAAGLTLAAVRASGGRLAGAFAALGLLAFAVVRHADAFLARTRLVGL